MTYYAYTYARDYMWTYISTHVAADILRNVWQKAKVCAQCVPFLRATCLNWVSIFALL